MKSMQEYGESAIEVHIWIDQYWNGVADDHSHREELHNREGLQKCVEKFGEWSKKHFILHMIDDGVR